MKFFFFFLFSLPFFLTAQADLRSKSAKLAPDNNVTNEIALLAPTNCVSVLVDRVCGGNNGHYLSGTIKQGLCNTKTIKKVKVRYRNITDNKSWNTRTYDYQGNWYVQMLDPNKEYVIEVSVKFSRTGVFRSAGTVRAWAGCNETRMTVNGISSGDFTSNELSRVTMDGSASTDENGYSIYITQVNGANRPVGREVAYHRNGQVPTAIDVKAVSAQQGLPFGFGKRYRIKLVTKPVWREKSVFLNYKSARGAAEMNQQSATQVRRIN